MRTRKRKLNIQRESKDNPAVGKQAKPVPSGSLYKSDKFSDESYVRFLMQRIYIFYVPNFFRIKINTHINTSIMVTLI